MRHTMRSGSGSAEKTYASGQRGGVGGPVAVGASSARSAEVHAGISGDPHDDGGVLIIAGAAAGKGRFGVAHVGEGGANG